MEIILETKNLTKTYDRTHAVNGVNLSIPKGKVYGFLGPNGAGKTTAIRMMLDLVKPTQGEISIFGQSFKNNRMEILRNIGSLVENPSYYGHLNGRENLEVFRILLGLPKQRISKVLDIVDLKHAAGKKVKQYSLGMKQRLGIAIALLGDPELLILDEPTNGLDPSGIHEIRTLIQQFSKNYGKTVIISSHLLNEVDQIADHVGIISNGRLVYQDDIESLRNHAEPETVFNVGQPEKARAILSRNNYSFSQSNDSIFAHKLQNSEIARTVKILVDHQIEIYAVEQKKASLEKIFLNIVRGG